MFISCFMAVCDVSRCSGRMCRCDCERQAQCQLNQSTTKNKNNFFFFLQTLEQMSQLYFLPHQFIGNSNDLLVKPLLSLLSVCWVSICCGHGDLD